MRRDEAMMEGLWDYISDHLESIKETFELVHVDEVDIDWVLEEFDAQELTDLRCEIEKLENERENR